MIGTLDETWRFVDEALRRGYRGLPKKPRSSLAQLLEKRRDVRSSEFPRPGPHSLEGHQPPAVQRAGVAVDGSQRVFQRSRSMRTDSLATHPQLMGTVQGAIASGLRAASEVLGLAQNPRGCGSIN